MAKTRAQRGALWHEHERLETESLLRHLSEVKTRREAWDLQRLAPGPDAPGRAAWGNFGFFLQYGAVPGDATARELRTYIAMVERIMQSGEFGDGVGDKMLAALRHAAETR